MPRAKTTSFKPRPEEGRALPNLTADELAQAQQELDMRRDQLTAEQANAVSTVKELEAAYDEGADNAPSPADLERARENVKSFARRIAAVGTEQGALVAERERRVQVAAAEQAESERRKRVRTIENYAEAADDFHDAIRLVAERYGAVMKLLPAVIHLFPGVERTSLPEMGQPYGPLSLGKLWLAAESDGKLATMPGLMTAHELIQGRASMGDEARVLLRMAADLGIV